MRDGEAYPPVSPDERDKLLKLSDASLGERYETVKLLHAFPFIPCFI
ncbi:MAG: hypothetical protein NC548_62095 [Lachnospiraceae bacterium]|nr:hypothetical protein [Lachnospiraceae bacterium]